jgi:hypothetical protein
MDLLRTLIRLNIVRNHKVFMGDNKMIYSCEREIKSLGILSDAANTLLHS